jgi:hypothetical protein
VLYYQFYQLPSSDLATRYHLTHQTGPQQQNHGWRFFSHIDALVAYLPPTAGDMSRLENAQFKLKVRLSR